MKKQVLNQSKYDILYVKKALKMLYPCLYISGEFIYEYRRPPPLKQQQPPVNINCFGMGEGI